MDNKDIILNILKESNEALKSGEIVEASGLEKKEVDKIIKKLKDEEIIFSPKRCYYQVK